MTTNHKLTDMQYYLLSLIQQERGNEAMSINGPVVDTLIAHNYVKGAWGCLSPTELGASLLQQTTNR